MLALENIKSSPRGWRINVTDNISPHITSSAESPYLNVPCRLLLSVVVSPLTNKFLKFLVRVSSDPELWLDGRTKKYLLGSARCRRNTR